MPLDSQMTAIQASIWKFLRLRYYGKGNVTPRKAILAWYNVARDSNIEDRIFRDEVVTLVKIFKKPICATPAGYFVARTEEEKEHTLNYLDSYISELAEHRRNLAEAPVEGGPGQRGLL